jgi:hypothetical protein
MTMDSYFRAGGWLTLGAMRAMYEGNMEHRKKAVWDQVEPNLYQWGEWFISQETSGFRLLISSGQSYGPFPTMDRALLCAENVRTD